jgi:hypothetical protein
MKEKGEFYGSSTEAFKFRNVMNFLWFQAEDGE